MDGSLLPVHGVLPILETAREEGCSLCFVPVENHQEASLLDGMRAVGFTSLQEVYHYLKEGEKHTVRESSSDNYAMSGGGALILFRGRFLFHIWEFFFLMSCRNIKRMSWKC